MGVGGGGGYKIISFREYNMFFRTKFMLTVSLNHGNPITYNVQR